MTWKSAKHDAEVRVAAMPLPPGKLGGYPVLLSDYEDGDTFQFLCGMSDNWSLEYFKMVNRAAARILRRRGARVHFFMIRLSEYFEFLARYKLENSPQNRAQYLGWATAPDPKPEPLKD